MEAARKTPTNEKKNDEDEPAPSASPDQTPLDRETFKKAVHDAFKGNPNDKDARAVENKVEQIGDVVFKKVEDNGGWDQSIRAVSENFQQRLSWVGLAMLPIFALMLRALYWRKDGFYFQHLIFSLHYHTFLMIFWLAYFWLGATLNGTFLGFVMILLLLAPPGYLFLALRRVYGGTTRLTWTKTILLGGMHLLAIFAGVCAIGATALFSALW